MRQLEASTKQNVARLSLPKRKKRKRPDQLTILMQSNIRSSQSTLCFKNPLNLKTVSGILFSKKKSPAKLKHAVGVVFLPISKPDLQFLICCFCWEVVQYPNDRLYKTVYCRKLKFDGKNSSPLIYVRLKSQAAIQVW